MFRNVISYLNSICIKDGDIEVDNINLKNCTFTLRIPVFNGELACKQIAVLEKKEFSYDGESIDLYGEFPRRLLSEEDLDIIRQKIWEYIEENNE